MGLVLAIPHQAADNNVMAETRPTRARQWLSKLPLMDPAESARQLYNGIYALNRVVVKAPVRLQLLELYRTPYQFVSEQAEKLLIQSYLPLPDKRLHFAELVLETANELAYGYKAVIMELAAGGWRGKKQIEDLCIATQRAVRYLTETIYKASLFYHAPPEGTWRELHNLYLYVRTMRMADRRLRDPMNTKQPISSIGQCYKQALLFGLCDNGSLSVPFMGKIYRYLDQYANHAEITGWQTPSSTRCQFVIEADQDQAPQAYRGDAEFEDTSKVWILDTREVTRTAHDQLQQLRTGVSPKGAGLDSEFLDTSAIDIMERLVHSWGVSSKRRSFRAESAGSFDLAVGLTTANYYLNGEKDFECISDDPVHYQQQMLAGSFGAQKANAHKIKSDDISAQTVVSVDRSDNGVRLTLDTASHEHLQVRVGSILVAKRAATGTEQKWAVGVVRWIRQEDTVLDLGLELVGDDLQAVAVKPVSANNSQEEQFRQSILAPARPEMGRTTSLITPPGIFRPQRNLFLDNGEILLMVRTTRMRERSRDYEWFEYEELNI